jgi:hypothetical protein
VGVWLADDLLRSSSKIRDRGRIRQTPSTGFAAAARQIADKVERHPGWLPRPSGRIKSHASNAVLLLPKAWESGLPTICCAAAVKLGTLAGSDEPPSTGFAAAARQIADKVERHPGWLLRPSGRIKGHAANAALLLPKA